MRFGLVFAAIAASISTLTGCSTGPGPAGQGNYGTIFGTVTSSATGKPIGSAGVVISVVVHTNTDANGMYRVTSVPIDSPGIDESVSVSAPGFQDQTKSVHVAAAGQQYEVDFQLQAAP